MYVLIENNKVTQAISGNPYHVYESQFASRFIEAPDYVIEGWTYDGSNFIGPSIPEQLQLPQLPTIIYHLENKNTAVNLLSQSDWVELPSVSDTNKNPHLLNKLDFDNYRQQLRDIAVNPPDNFIENWPSLPVEHWSS